VSQFKKLSPVEAGIVADGIYTVGEGGSLKDTFQDSGVDSYFDFTNSATVLDARSGAFQLKTKSGFATAVKGKGDYKSHALLAFRGTMGFKDVLTDANAGIQARSGSAVHAGFNRTFEDMDAAIHQFISITRPSYVHCVGHSLGGALANLCAESLLSRSDCPKLSLYTFGAPRVGFSSFVEKLSNNKQLGAKDIHRVYHGGDPVSMVPLWPFVHAPQPSGECYVGKALGFNPMQHLMGNYMASIKSHKGWETLRCAHPNLNDHWKEWLESPKTFRFAGLNLYNLRMLSKAIQIAVNGILRMRISFIPK